MCEGNSVGRKILDFLKGDSHREEDLEALIDAVESGQITLQQAEEYFGGKLELRSAHV